jgi:trans-2-enoyl-CoA reductase
VTKTVEELAKQIVDLFDDKFIDRYYFKKGDDGIRNHISLDKKKREKFDYEELIDEIQKEIGRRKFSKGC